MDMLWMQQAWLLKPLPQMVFQHQLVQAWGQRLELEMIASPAVRPDVAPAAKPSFLPLVKLGPVYWPPRPSEMKILLFDRKSMGHSQHRSTDTSKCIISLLL